MALTGAAASGSRALPVASTVAGAAASPSTARPTVAGATTSRSPALAMASTVDGASASRPPARASFSFAGASTSRSPSKWAALDRVVTFVGSRDRPAAASASAFALEYAVDFTAPPGISTMQIKRADVPIADDLEARVECADAEGNLVLSLSSPTAGPGASDLLVCPAGTTRVVVLPRIRADDGELRFGPHSSASTGILPDAAPPGFKVVHLQRAAEASSSRSCASSAPLLALSYSSKSSSWTVEAVDAKQPPPQAQATDEDSEWLLVEEVRADKEEEGFHPNTVIAHEDGRHLLFVDIKGGVLLVFDAMPPSSTARLLQLPDSGGRMDDGDINEAATRRCVACAHRTVCLLEMRDGLVNLWMLGEQDQWSRMFQVCSDEVLLNKDCTIGDLVTPVLGPVDPTKTNTFSVYVPDTGMGFKGFNVSVDPAMYFLKRVHVSDPASAGDNRGSCLDVVVWRFNPADPATAARTTGWLNKLADDAKWALGTGLKHAAKVEPVAQAAVAFGVPYAPAIAAVASGLTALNKAASTSEELGAHIKGMLSTNKTKLVVRAVGNETEALELIEEWKLLGKPSHMLAKPASHLDQNQVDALRLLFERHEATALLWVFSDYVMVGEALDF